MMIKILCLNFNSVTGKFDDGELVNFIKDNDVISSSEYFFTKSCLANLDELLFF